MTPCDDRSVSMEARAASHEISVGVRIGTEVELGNHVHALRSRVIDVCIPCQKLALKCLDCRSPFSDCVDFQDPEADDVQMQGFQLLLSVSGGICL